MPIYILRISILSCIVLIINAFHIPEENMPHMAPPFLQNDTAWVDSVFNTLRVDEKIAQLLMVAVYPNKDTALLRSVEAAVKKYNLGGIIVFQGGPVHTASVLNRLQALAKTPLLTGIDGEWGLSMRIDSTLVYPKQLMLGAMADNKQIYQMAADIAWQLKRMGLHTNFSPVLDINNNPRNPVIGSRSFGEDREKVLEKGMAYMLGLQDNHILATAKHFPGHGDTETDSHLDLPLLPYSRNRIDSLELYPFKKLINQGVSSIMVAHLNVPALDSSGRPSSLSKRIVDSLLCRNLGFEGLIITDALNMKGVSNYCEGKSVALEALLAGNDVLLMPENIDETIETIKQAIDSGKVALADIDRKCKKVLKAKYWLGLNKYEPVVLDNLITDLHQPRFELLKRQLVESSITVVRNENNLLPLQCIDTMNIACVSIGMPDTSTFQQVCSNYSRVHFYQIDRNASDSAFSVLYSKLRQYNLILAAIVNTDIRASKKFGITDVSISFLTKLADSCNVVLSVFANPYALNRFEHPERFRAIVVGFEDKDINQDLTAQLIFGGIPAKGLLPVKAAYYLAGTGIQWPQTTRLKYTIPEEVGIASSALAQIDSLVNDGIKRHAMPGSVVLLAKEGKVFYHKAFGYQTYDSLMKVSTATVYDIASLTKVTATLPAVMRLYDERRLNVNAHISNYLPQLKKTNKGKLFVRDILSHQARLQAFEPLYLKVLKTTNAIAPQADSAKALRTAAVGYSQRLANGLFDSVPGTKFNREVAWRMYTSASLADSVLKWISVSALLQKAGYRYSDYGFIIMGKALEYITSITLDKYTDSVFYKPMGAANLCYNPLHTMPATHIAPTERDTVFRNQLLQGYVHDPTAAMMGGVSGHAGLFANANDLAKLMQTYLNRGSYGGKRYMEAKTVDLFTSRTYAKYGNRRSLGFDKPEPDVTKASPVSRLCSDESYGHTGYTGTMVWVDPAYQLVYIFLSNRVCPDASKNKLAEMNIRTNIQDVIYKAIHAGTK